MNFEEIRQALVSVNQGNPEDFGLIENYRDKNKTIYGRWIEALYNPLNQSYLKDENMILKNKVTKVSNNHKKILNLYKNYKKLIEQPLVKIRDNKDGKKYIISMEHKSWKDMPIGKDIYNTSNVFSLYHIIKECEIFENKINPNFFTYHICIHNLEERSNCVYSIFKKKNDNDLELLHVKDSKDIELLLKEIKEYNINLSNCLFYINNYSVSTRNKKILYDNFKNIHMLGYDFLKIITNYIDLDKIIFNLYRDNLEDEDKNNILTAIKQAIKLNVILSIKDKGLPDVLYNDKYPSEYAEVLLAPIINYKNY